MTSVFSGGLVGLLGTIANKIFELKMTELKMKDDDQKAKNQLLMSASELEQIKAENEGKFKIADREVEGQMDIAASQSFAASYTLEPKMYHSNKTLTTTQNTMLVFVDAMRGLIRPGLTMSLCVIMMIVYMKAGKIIENKDLSAEQALKIYTEVTQAIIFLTTLSVSWWFGERASKPKKKG